MTEPMVQELRQEAETTRRLVDRIPGDKLAWRPHPKSMTLGELGLHVATIPGNLSGLAQLNEFDASNANFTPASPASKQDIVTALEASVQTATQYIEGLSAETAAANWRLTHRGNEVFSLPRAAMIRSLMLNHWYHHRGQLSVYLRLLDVPVPVIYGRSADENPFS
jgi:uncharacterized damage-inducible protein DinB